jgi:hypothetical protein
VLPVLFWTSPSLLFIPSSRINDRWLTSRKLTCTYQATHQYASAAIYIKKLVNITPSIFLPLGLQWHRMNVAYITSKPRCITMMILSQVHGCMTNNNGVSIGWLDLLTSSLQSLIITINYNISQSFFSSPLFLDCQGLASFSFSCSCSFSLSFILIWFGPVPLI